MSMFQGPVFEPELIDSALVIGACHIIVALITLVRLRLFKNYPIRYERATNYLLLVGVGLEIALQTLLFTGSVWSSLTLTIVGYTIGYALSVPIGLIQMRFAANKE